MPLDITDERLARLETLNLPPHEAAVLAGFHEFCRSLRDLIARAGGNPDVKGIRALREQAFAVCRYRLGMPAEEFSELTDEALLALLHAIAGIPSRRSGRKPGKPGTPVDGERLKAYRAAAGLTQERLAELAAPVGVSTIQRGEAGGRWTGDTLDRVAAALAEAGARSQETGRAITAQDITSHHKHF
jgi:hypothetical protein